MGRHVSASQNVNATNVLLACRRLGADGLQRCITMQCGKDARCLRSRWEQHNGSIDTEWARDSGLILDRRSITLTRHIALQPTPHLIEQSDDIHESMQMVAATRQCWCSIAHSSRPRFPLLLVAEEEWKARETYVIGSVPRARGEKKSERGALLIASFLFRIAQHPFFQKKLEPFFDILKEPKIWKMKKGSHRILFFDKIWSFFLITIH